MQKLRIAVFVDAENVSDVHWQEIAVHVGKTGWMNICQLFGDFRAGRLAGWLKVAQKHGLEPMLQTPGGKNCSDIAMTIAAMDVLHAGSINAAYIVSSDADFAPLARRLRAGGIKVFGLGLSKAPDTLRNACEFKELGGDAGSLAA